MILHVLLGGWLAMAGASSPPASADPTNTAWPQPVTPENLQALAHRPAVEAAAPSATDIFFEADMAASNWYTAYDLPLDTAAVKDYEFDNKRKEPAAATSEPASGVWQKDGKLFLKGQWDRQTGIRLAPTLWKSCPDKRFILGVEMELTGLALRGYYLSPQISQGSGRGTQRWLTHELPTWTRVEFIASAKETPITLGNRGNRGLWTIRRLYLRRIAVEGEDAFPWKLDAQEAARPLRVAVDTSHAQEANPLLHGFNPNLIRTAQGFGSPQVREVVRQTGIRALRFPMGTQANWYEWERDGWPPSEELPPATPEFVISSLAELQAKRGGKMGLPAYQTLSREQGLAPVLVLNILTETPESQAAWAKAMQAAGAPTRYFELGNETYHFAQANKATATGPEYVAHTRAYAEAIRQVVPDARFAVAAEDRNTRNDGYAWNHELAKADFADAVVLHTYTHAFGVPLNREMVGALLYPENQLAEKVLLKREQFPHWRIWNTEWGVNAPPIKPYGTQLGAIQTAAYLLALISWHNDFELAALHCLATGEYSPVDLRDDGSVRLKRPYFAHVLAGPLFQPGVRWLGTAIDEGAAPLEGGYPRASARAFRDADGRLGMLVINRLPVAKPLAVSLDGQAIPAQGTVRSLSAPHLADASTVGAGKSLITETPLSETTLLPPYSVNLVQWEKPLP